MDGLLDKSYLFIVHNNTLTSVKNVQILTNILNSQCNEIFTDPLLLHLIL